MALAGMLTQQIVIERFTGRDNYGQPQFNPVQIIADARVESKMELVRDRDGDERASSTQVVTLTVVNPADRVWLPGDDPTNPSDSIVPIAVSSAQTPAGDIVMYHLYF
jgi:hypothetical protein